MTEYEYKESAVRPGADTKDHPLDPPAAPALSWPTSDEQRPPADNNPQIEATQVFAVLSLITLSLLLFLALVFILQRTVF